MILQNSISNDPPFITLDGNNLQNVSEYKFLGTIIKNNGNLSHCLDDLAKKGTKVLFSIKEKSSSLGRLPVNVSNNLFDKLVYPIMTYNAEVSFMDNYLTYFRAKTRATKTNKTVDLFSFIDRTPFEKVHLNFCKYVLGVKKSSSNIGSRTELGRLPLENRIIIQSLIYFSRLHTEEINPLLREALELTKLLDQKGVYSWSTYIKDILRNLNLESELFSSHTDKEFKSLKLKIKNEVIDKYKSIYRNKLNSFDETSKLCLYKNIKESTEPEFYLNYDNFTIRRLFAKMRISDHNLEIEKGRYFKIPREERLCKSCKEVDDETHFLIYCKLNQQLREHLFSKIKDLSLLPENNKVSYLLNPKIIEHVSIIGFFIKRSLELRAEVS